MFVFIVESSVEHLIDDNTYATCIEGVFATEEAARAYLADNGYVEEDGDNVFRHSDCDDWNSPEMILIAWPVQ